MKIANIHYNEMEKADRDYTHAKRAEEEYRQLIMQFPDSPLVPEAKKKLLAVQEVLADREFGIAHFYFLHEAYPAAIARFKSLTDTYPLFSGADEALYEMGNCYERQVEVLRRSKLSEAAKAPLIAKYNNDAVAAYDRILTQYPLEDRADDARKKLQAMGKPIPKATPEATAQNKKEQESRGSLGTYGRMMLNFKKGPDVSQAATVGEPTLVDPKQTSAPEIVRSASATMMQALNAATNATAPAAGAAAASNANANAPKADTSGASAAPAETGTSGGTTLSSGVEVVNQPAGSNAAAVPTPALAPAPAQAKDDNSIPEMGNDLAQPASGATNGAAPPLPPTQVNDAPKTGPTDSSAASTDSSNTPATAADPNTESSSKKKKKKHLLVF